MTHDVIVVGVGGMGSAAALPPGPARPARARPGAVRRPARRMGSSHGFTRIIRLAYYEHPRTCRCCAAPTSCGASSRSGRASSCCTSPARSTPGRRTVGLQGRAASCRGARARARGADWREMTDALPRLPAAARRCSACSSPTAASSRPSAASSPTSSTARRLGAEIHARERVLRWEPLGDGACASTPTATCYEADSLVITAGAWIDGIARPPGRPRRARAPGAGLAPAAAARALPAGATSRSST